MAPLRRPNLGRRQIFAFENVFFHFNFFFLGGGRDLLLTVGISTQYILPLPRKKSPVKRFIYQIFVHKNQFWEKRL
jgi:hypothetical protein